jgi:glycosyltransferase involved in cell wall biosynthesis
MKRIGLYLDFPPHGGGAFQYATSILAALHALPATEYQPVVAHAHSSWAQWLTIESSRMETHLVTTSMRDAAARLLLRFGLPASIWRNVALRIGGMERQLASFQCDIWIFPAQDYLSYSMPGPTIGTIHDLMHRHERDFPEVSALGLYRRRERHYRNMCSHARAILVDSRTGKRHVHDAYDIASERIHVLPYVAPSYIHESVAPSGFDQRYELPSSYFFYPAQLWQHKNHIRLVEALALARRRIPGLCLVFAGSEKNNGYSIRTTVEKLGLSDAVTFLGYVPDEDMAELYRRSEGLVMPTFFGPTNIPPLEALATGTPMALSDIYAMREQSGDAAIYFDPSCVNSLAEAMIALASNETLRKNLISQGRKRNAELTQDRFNERFAEILHRAITE